MGWLAVAAGTVLSAGGMGRELGDAGPDSGPESTECSPWPGGKWPSGSAWGPAVGR